MRVFGVWGSGPSGVWEVGVPGALHFDGAVWAPVAIAGMTGGFAGVGGTGPDDVWIVGAGAGGTILHKDGGGWTTATTLAGMNYRIVVALGPKDVWVAGTDASQDPAFYRYDGTSWSAGPVLTTYGQALSRFWASSDTDLYATDVQGLAWHCNGTAWAPMAMPSTFEPGAIWGTAANDVWMVGQDAADLPVFLLHYDGTAWTSAPAEASTLQFPEVLWGSGPKDVWAAGTVDVWHWDGTSWTVVPFPFPSATNMTASDGLYLAAGWSASPGDAWMVGTPGAALHWDGAAWSSGLSDDRRPPDRSPASRRRATCGPWASRRRGGRGVVHRTASGWSSEHFDMTDIETLNGIWEASATDLWAVGATDIVNGTSPT